MPSATPQPVDTTLTSAAIFLIFTLDPGDGDDGATVRNLYGDLSALVRGVGFRIPDGRLSCVTGIGSDAWERVFKGPKPKELHPFRAIHGVHEAPATPGDLVFHIRATRMDLCFELATAITARLDGVARVVDEVHGFKYFDARDLLGFVDGTENPVNQAATDATVIGDEDPDFAGGSYVIIQKYLHDLKKWDAIPVEQQEKIIGRRKLSDIELPEAAKPSYAHNVLTNIEENGEQLQIVRDNMPFGEVGKGEFGTYFIGYAKTPTRVERMLDNMFIGNPPGNYDRLLDVSRAVTGVLFFIPTADFLDAAPTYGEAAAPADSTEDTPASPPTTPDGSLGIGSLKEEV
ncbi:putative deferrochelatase/peroxidase YfeX [Komagataeibacter europaeus]|uniref:Iron-dependent peroxidase n=2 Tax=Komagataeibacter europaeus TaxID=33995 RepID=A0A0D6PXD4_KOMEU|nr:Dyp-type peroxidase [Komagataeibacter europaeus]ARW15651.1 putative deferrochelatase/peroxidase YfeX [Komagataeibacter europaeus]KON65263.1 putative deferrochelatase/peroxidase YfeX [Komagataeibacter europaeus]GAN95425.1 iron-dependent peroxidase [Komagataeibacter europaeus NBRC 3261]